MLVLRGSSNSFGLLGLHNSQFKNALNLEEKGAIARNTCPFFCALGPRLGLGQTFYCS